MPKVKGPAEGRITGRTVIDQLIRNMELGQFEMAYSTLLPCIFSLYLHPDDYTRLTGVFDLIKDDAKRALAHDLVQWLYSAADADAAERHFDRVFVDHEAPEEIEEAGFHSDGGLVHLPGVMAEEFGISRSQARRLIDQGGVTLGDSQLAAGEHDVPNERAEGQVLKVGKRRFRRLRAR